jgi:cytochrome c-type biogenesis protein CcmH/NrfG
LSSFFFFPRSSPDFSFLGRVAEQMGDLEHALSAYENALRHNALSVSGLTQVAGIARIKENYAKVSTYPSYFLMS